MRMWVMRNTVHLIATDDLPWMRPLFAPRMEAFDRRRLGQLGVDARAQDRVLAAIRKALDSGEPVSRGELSEHVERLGIEVTPERRVHTFPLAVSAGVACIGPGEGAKATLVATADWLPRQRDRPRDEALAELARRYFAAFGPATEADLAGWAGLPLRDVRAGMAAIAAELREVEIEGARAWTPKGRAPKLDPRLVRLLPAFDNYLMGYRDRSFLTTPERWKRIGPGGGILWPTITVGGTAAGVWKVRRAGGRLSIELEPFSPLDQELAQAVEAEVADVRRFERA